MGNMWLTLFDILCGKQLMYNNDDKVKIFYPKVALIAILIQFFRNHISAVAFRCCVVRIIHYTYKYIIISLKTYTKIDNAYFIPHQVSFSFEMQFPIKKKRNRNMKTQQQKLKKKHPNLLPSIFVMEKMNKFFVFVCFAFLCY